MTRLIKLVFASGLLLTALIPLRGQTVSEAAEAAAFARAQQAEKAGNYRAAERIYQTALREHPGQMAAELNLGLAYYLERRYADSSVYLLKALDAKPDSFPALMVAGVDMMKLGNPQRAVPFLRHALQLSPENEYVNYNLASAEYLAGNYVQACADYSHYLRLPRQETNVPAWYGLGEVSLLLARRASQELGKLPVSNPYRLRILVMFYSERQEWGLAVARLTQLEGQPAWCNWARLKIAEIYLRQGNFDQAAGEFQKAVSAEPSSAQAHFGLGESLLLEGKPGAARPDFEAAASDPWLFAHPDALAALTRDSDVRLGVVRSARNASALVNAFLLAVGVHGNPSGGNERLAIFDHAYQQACSRAHKADEDQLKKLLSHNPASQQLLQFSSDLLEKGDEQASSDALADTRTGPETAMRSILQARLRARQGDTLGIVDLLLPLLEKTTGQPSPEADLWVSNLFQRAAELALNRVLNLAPNSIDAHLLKAQMEEAHSRTEDAIQEFRLAVGSAPDDPDTHFKLGEALWRAGHFQEAVSALHQGLALNPRNAPAYYQIGDSYLSLAKPAQAVPFLTEAVKRDPDLSAAYKDLGNIYLSQGKIRQSVAILRKIAVRDTDGSVHYMLFRDYSRLGEQAQAAVCLKRFHALRKATEDQALFNAETAAHLGARTAVQYR